MPTRKNREVANTVRLPENVLRVQCVERKHGTLRSGKGGKVKSRTQTVAIGLSEARKKGAKVAQKNPSPTFISRSKSRIMEPLAFANSGSFAGLARLRVSDGCEQGVGTLPRVQSRVLHDNRDIGLDYARIMVPRGIGQRSFRSLKRRCFVRFAPRRCRRC